MDKESWLKFGDWLSLILVVIGSLNWGLIVFGINLVTLFFNSILITLVYLLIGISSVWFFVRFIILKDFEVGR